MTEQDVAYKAIAKFMGDTKKTFDVMHQRLSDAINAINTMGKVIAELQDEVNKLKKRQEATND